MNPVSLQEKYNRSRKLGYIPRDKGSLYPSLAEDHTNKQSYQRINLNRFTNNSYKESNNYNNSNSYKEPSKFNGTSTDREDISSNRASSKYKQRGRLYHGSPIKSLAGPFTPTRLKPTKLYKILNTTPNVNKSILSNKNKNKNKRYRSKDLKVSSSGGIFSRLRRYLTKFNLVNYESDDSNLALLKDSTRNLLNIKVDSEKSYKKVSFKDNKENIENFDLDDDIVDDTIQWNENLKSQLKINQEISSLKEALNKERSKNEELIGKYDDQIKQLENTYNSKIDSLNDTIDSLRKQIQISNSKVEKLKLEELEENLFKEHEIFLIKQKEKEEELQMALDQLDHEKQLLLRRQQEFEAKVKNFNDTNSNSEFRRQLNLNKCNFKNEKSYLLQDKLKTSLRLQENEADYSRICKLTNLNLSLLPSKKSTNKYEKIRVKFEEYSNFLKSSNLNDSLNLIEIECLFSKLKENLIASKFKKNNKINLIDDDLLKVKIKVNKNVHFNVNEIYKCFNKKQNLLNDLRLINNLLIELNVLFKQLNDLIILNECQSTNANVLYNEDSSVSSINIDI